MEQQLTWEAEKPKPGKLIFSLTVPGRLPSWNDILGMEHYSRHTLKKHLAKEFLSCLRATAADSSIKIICAPSTLLTYAATLESFLAMRLVQRKSRLLKKKLALKNPNGSSSTSTLFDKPKPKLPF